VVWQDFVIAGMSTVLVLPPLKMLREGTKPFQASCLMIIGPLSVESAVFLTLNLWWSSGLLALNVVAWAALLISARSGKIKKRRMVVPNYLLKCVACQPVVPRGVRLSHEELERVRRGENVLVFCELCGGHRFQVVPAPFSFRMTG